jgi:hypothetical protein
MDGKNHAFVLMCTAGHIHDEYKDVDAIPALSRLVSPYTENVHAEFSCALDEKWKKLMVCLQELARWILIFRLLRIEVYNTKPELVKKQLEERRARLEYEAKVLMRVDCEVVLSHGIRVDDYVEITFSVYQLVSGGEKLDIAQLMMWAESR